MWTWCARERVIWFITSDTLTGLIMSHSKHSQHPIFHIKMTSLFPTQLTANLTEKWQKNSKYFKLQKREHSEHYGRVTDNNEQSLQQMRCQMDQEHVLQHKQHWVNKAVLVFTVMLNFVPSETFPLNMYAVPWLAFGWRFSQIYLL